MNDQSSHVSEEDRLSEEERKDKKAAQMTGAQAVPPEQEEEESENDDSTGNGGLLKKTMYQFFSQKFITSRLFDYVSAQFYFQEWRVLRFRAACLMTNSRQQKLDVSLTSLQVRHKLKSCFYTFATNLWVLIKPTINSCLADLLYTVSSSKLVRCIIKWHRQNLYWLKITSKPLLMYVYSDNYLDVKCKFYHFL